MRGAGDVPLNARPAIAQQPERLAARRLPASLVGAIALAACLAAITSCGLLRQLATPTPRPAPEGEGDAGTFRTVDGVRVLTLWGDPYRRGFAHGKLLAPAILDMVNAVCGSSLLLTHVKDYEREILPLMDRFDFEPDDEAELRGMLDGIRARLGDGAVLRHFQRPLTLNDLKAYNTAGDWYRQACSSFAAWGSRTQDGHVWVGRNFDFVPAKVFFPNQMIVVHRRLGARKAWATIAAPGLIGCITGVNEDGVFTCVHDVFLPLRPLEEHYYPRLLVLRRLMETCSPRGLEAQARPVLEARRQLFDNAILLAAPVRDGTPPALVFEYNGDRSRDQGVTVRSPADNEKSLSRELIICANHFRKRARPRLLAALDYRYAMMRHILMARSRRDEKVGFELARRTMAASRLPITVHSVIADLDTLDVWFAPGAFLSPPHGHDFTKLPIKDWLAPK